MADYACGLDAVHVGMVTSMMDKTELDEIVTAWFCK